MGCVGTRSDFEKIELIAVGVGIYNESTGMVLYEVFPQ